MRGLGQAARNMRLGWGPWVPRGKLGPWPWALAPGPPIIMSERDQLHETLNTLLPHIYIWGRRWCNLSILTPPAHSAEPNSELFIFFCGPYGLVCNHGLSRTAWAPSLFVFRPSGDLSLPFVAVLMDFCSSWDFSGVGPQDCGPGQRPESP